MPSGELEQSLRSAIDGYLNSQLSELEEELTRLQSEVNQALARISERLAGETQPDASVAVAIAEHLRAAHERGIEEAAAGSARARASSDLAIIKAAVDDIDNQRSQTDILTALVNRASSFAPRVAFFVIKNEQAVGWRARGLEGTVGDEAVREISLPLSADTILSEAARSRATWSGTPGSHADDHELFQHLGDEPPQRMVAIPLVARGRAVAVLYADSAVLESNALNLEALETLVRVAGMAVELLATKRPAPAATAAPAPPPRQWETAAPAATESVSAAPESERAEEMAAEAAPAEASTAAAPEEQTEAQPAAAEEPAAMPSSAGDEEPTPARVAEPQAAPLAPEYSASESAQPAETSAETSMPAAETIAPATPPASVSPLGTARRYGQTDADLPVEVSDEERRYHNEARRFARLLVSEIKLYNEQKVQDGRAQGDLYDRLREEIDRSRQMYDKRVSPNVTARYDYFHHELVNTLAGGDPDKLGNGYRQ